MRRYAAFVLVGATGFLVDAGLLKLLLAITPLGPFAARILSIAAAMTCTWLLNRLFTFGPSRHAKSVEAARYAGVALAVAGANYLIYSALILGVPAIPPVLAVAIASAAAMLLSYSGYARLVFR